MRRIFAVLAGRPDNYTYLQSSRAAYEAFAKEGQEAMFSPGITKHRRGHFPAVNVGVTCGNGLGEPANLKAEKHMVAATP